MDGGLQVRKLMLETPNPLRCCMPWKHWNCVDEEDEGQATAFSKGEASARMVIQQRHCLMHAHAGRTFLQRSATITCEEREAQRISSHLISSFQRDDEEEERKGVGLTLQASSPSISARTRRRIILAQATTRIARTSRYTTTEEVPAS